MRIDGATSVGKGRQKLIAYEPPGTPRKPMRSQRLKMHWVCNLKNFMSTREKKKGQ